jgi:solute carrier family 6 amino acid transporter-like protein 5/7/9/14
MGEFGGFYWPTLGCYLLAWSLVYYCLKDGIKKTGKIAYFTVLSPYVLLIILLIRVLFLEGSVRGIQYLFIPDFKKLWTIEIWTEAATQSAFQYSIGVGSAQTFARFRARGTSTVKPGIIVPVANYLSGILASLVVFGYLGHYIHVKGISFEDLPMSGPELVSITYPAILGMLPLPNLMAMLFFFTMILLGIDSEFGNVEVCSTFVDDLGWTWKGKKLGTRQTKLISIAALASFGVIQTTHGGWYIFRCLDDYIYRIPSSCSALGTIYCFCWYVDSRIMFRNVAKLAGERAMEWAI